MHDFVGASVAVAALTFGLYSLTMTVGRFLGDNLVLRLGIGMLVRTGGAIAAGGLTLALVFPTKPMVLLGFAVFGLGLSCQAPTLFRAAGQLPLPEGQGLAAVMAAAWPSFLLVGPVIGGLKQLTSYPVAFSVTVAAALAMVVLSGLLGRLSPVPVGAIESESG
jgi:MFS family permease